MYIIYKYVKHIYIGDFMISLKDKLIYCLVLVVFLISGVTFGYFQTRFSSGISVNNESLLDYARDYAFNPNMKEAVSVSTKTYDIEVVYEDDYSGCGESVTNSKMEYGTTIDEVKEKEKKYQEENGLNYNVKAEGTNRIIYARTDGLNNKYINKNDRDDKKIIFIRTRGNKIRNIKKLQNKMKGIM